MGRKDKGEKQQKKKGLTKQEKRARKKAKKAKSERELSAIENYVKNTPVDPESMLRRAGNP